MFSFLYFFHITGLAVWLGSLVSLSILIILINKILRFGELTNKFVQIINKMIKWVMNPSALVILLTGFMMTLQMEYTSETKPLWLKLMEQAGGLILILSIITFTIQSNRISKKMISKGTAVIHIESSKLYSSILPLMMITIILILGVTMIVSLKIM
ncbi:hypothetical protein [Effusibacillus consociatus]|uniref:Copper resistance protein D domain-containing protein n=1 Tax=Effusibacillus consociatus TaxID=1117041 RepID=A0ABV9Q4G2_9BACL